MASTPPTSPAATAVPRGTKRTANGVPKSESTEEVMDSGIANNPFDETGFSKKFQDIVDAAGKGISENRDTINSLEKAKDKYAASYDVAFKKMKAAEKERDEALKEMKTMALKRSVVEKGITACEAKNKKLWKEATAEIKSLLENPPRF